MVQQRRTKYLSLRMTPQTFEVLQAEAADAGLTKSSFVRRHLVQALKERRYRRKLLGLERSSQSQPYIENQCSAPPAGRFH